MLNILGWIKDIIKVVLPLSFYLFNVTTRKFKITHMAHILFSFDSAGPKGSFDLNITIVVHPPALSYLRQ